jgi:hypothetical protein
MTRVRTVLAAGLVLTAVAVALTLSHAPLTLARVNPVHTVVQLSRTAVSSYAEGCQADETLPRDTTAIHLSMFAVVGPQVAITIFSGPRLLTSGTEAPGWVGSVATVPLAPLPRMYQDVTLCFKLSAINGPVQLNGAHTPRAEAVTSHGEALPGRMRVEYLRPGHSSWWSLARGVAWRMGLGHAGGGAFGVVLAGLLAAAALAVSTLAVAGGLR